MDILNYLITKVNSKSTEGVKYIFNLDFESGDKEFWLELKVEIKRGMRYKYVKQEVMFKLKNLKGDVGLAFFKEEVDNLFMKLQEEVREDKRL